MISIVRTLLNVNHMLSKYSYLCKNYKKTLNKKIMINENIYHMCFFFSPSYFRFSQKHPIQSLFVKQLSLNHLTISITPHFPFSLLQWHICQLTIGISQLFLPKVTSSSSFKLFIHQYLLTFQLFLLSLEIIFFLSKLLCKKNLSVLHLLSVL